MVHKSTAGAQAVATRATGVRSDPGQISEASCARFDAREPYLARCYLQGAPASTSPNVGYQALRAAATRARAPYSSSYMLSAHRNGARGRTGIAVSRPLHNPRPDGRRARPLSVPEVAAPQAGCPAHVQGMDISRKTVAATRRARCAARSRHRTCDTTYITAVSAKVDLRPTKRARTRSPSFVDLSGPGEAAAHARSKWSWSSVVRRRTCTGTSCTSSRLLRRAHRIIGCT